MASMKAKRAVGVHVGLRTPRGFASRARKLRELRGLRRLTPGSALRYVARAHGPFRKPMHELSGYVTYVERSPIPLWLIPLLPFLGAAINAIFGRDLQASDWGKEQAKKWHIGSAGVSAVAVGAMLLAFALVVASFV